MRKLLFLFKISIILIALLEALYGKDIDPLKEFTYDIVIENYSKNIKRDVKIKNNLNELKGVLANNGENFLDVEGSVFTSWEIYKDGERINSGERDSLDEVITELYPNQVVKYKIVAKPDKKLLHQIVKNEVVIYEGGQISEKLLYKNEVLESKPKIKREVDSDSYTLGGYLTYKVIVEPDNSGYLNNYIIDESIQDILVPTLSGKDEPFLKDIQIKTNQKTSGVGVDIANGESLIYEIKGRVNDKILGDVIYKELTIKSPPPSIKAKILNSGKYSPGRLYTYEVEIENSGLGNAKAVPIRAFMKRSEARDWTEEMSPAFLNAQDINERVNIAAGEKIVKKYSVTTSQFLIGDIYLNFVIDSHTYNNKIESHSPEPHIIARVERYLDKTGKKKIDSYTPEGYIEYLFRVENRGKGILKEYDLDPSIDEIKTKSAHGDEILAFSSSDTKNILERGEGARLLPDGFVEYRVLGKVSKDAVGDIKKGEIVSKMSSSDITHSFSVSKENYKPGENIEYTVTLKNNGLGTSYGIPYKLGIADAKVKQSGMQNRDVNPFKNDEKIESVPVIYPGEEFKYTFKGITKNNIFESINVDSIYGENKKSSTVTALPGKLEFTNTLKSLNGKILNKTTKYKPGDMVTYEIQLKNIGEGFLSNLSVESNLEEVKALLAGSDVKERALESVEVSVKSSDPRTVITSEMGDTVNYIRKSIDFAPKSSITFQISGVISDKALGTLSGLVFKINSSSKTSEGLSSVSGSIKGEKTLLEPENGVYKPGDRLRYMLTIKNSGEGYGRYIPVEDLLSEVSTEKEGKRYGRAFSNWKVTYLGPRDESSRFKQYTYLKNEVSGREDLNTKVDIGPGVAIEFLIEADIDKDAIGVIESKAKIAGGTNDDQTIFLKPISEYSEEEKVEQGIRVKLTSTKSEIKIGEVVGFTVSVENRDNKTYENLSLKNITPRGFRYLEDELEKFSLTPNQKYSKTFYMKATVGASVGKNIFQSSVSSRNNKISNIGETSVEVKADSLLNTATIIGKVIDEKTDKGIPYAVVYTPGGIVVQADDEGRFHLPDQWVDKKFGENFLLKLDENSLPSGSVVKSENPMVKRITPYSLTKFNFVVQTPEKSLESSESSDELKVDDIKLNYTGTGFIDAYVGKDSESPRATYFGKASYGDYKLTLHFDTKDRKSTTLLERVTDDEYVYYPTYGDDSKIRKEVNTKGKVYLKFQHKDSSLLWGTYETGFLGTRFMDYNKELYGFKGEYKQDDINVKVFASTPNTMYGHDEFLGTGGSLYFLKNGDILKGSQKVWIKVVDADTYVVEKIIYLQEGRDYEIDSFIGRIILTTPLSGGGSADYYAYLVADYSYIPKDGEISDSSNYGVKTVKDINENVQVGVTAIHESRGKENYDLKGVEIKLHDEKGNYLKGEFSQSEGVSNINNHLSFDGGLTFQSVGRDDDKITGNAYRITGAVKLLEEAEFKAWYERKERGYSFASDFEDRFFQTFGGELAYTHSERLKSYLKFQYIDEMKWGEERESGTVSSAKLEYILNESTKIYSEIKAGISNAISLGAEKRVNDRFKVNTRTSFGDSGNYYELGGDYQLYDNYNIYSGYSSDGEISRDRYTIGQRARVGERTSLYQENQFIKERGKEASLQGYGIDYDLRRGVTIGGAIQYGEVILPNDEKSDRRGISLYLRSESEKLTLKNRVEYRSERGNEEIEQYLTTNSFTYRYSKEYTLAGKLNYSFTDDSYENRYLQSSVGLAYRPISNDRLNYLSRYTMILDKDTKAVKDFSAYIAEFETIYSPTRRLDLSLKNGYRREKNVYLNDLYMLGLKANYTVMNSWEVYGQYQWLLDRANEDVLNGAIFGVYKNLDKNMKLGGGYNFSGFKDSLGEEEYKTSGWFLNIIGSM